MRDDHALRRQMSQIAGEGLACEQMHRNGVRRKCIEHDQIVTLRLCRECQPSVALHDLRRWRTGREEAKNFWITGDPHDFWIDLEERPLLAFAAVASEAAGAEPYEGYLTERAAHAARSLDCIRYWSPEVVVGEWLGPSGNRITGFARTRIAPWIVVPWKRI